MRIIQWNLNLFTAKRWPTKVGLIKDIGCDILCVQECDATVYGRLIEAGLGSGGHFHGLVEGYVSAADPAKSFGSAILANAPWELCEGAVLNDLPHPERGVTALAKSGTSQVSVLAWHSPHAVGSGPERMVAKMSAYKVVVDYLASSQGPLIAAMDANTPWLDPPDRGAGVLDEGHPFFQDTRLYGNNRAHMLDDAWCRHLAARPEQAERVKRLRPEGPLAVSFNRGTGGSTLACRYDLVMVSREIEVLNMGYEFADAVGAGSDHALVWADLRWRPDRKS